MTLIGFWTNDCTNTSPPIRSYSSLLMPVLGYVLGSRYIISLFRHVAANSMIRTYLSSPTMKPRSSSCGFCRTSPPSSLRPMLNLLILVPRRIGRKIRKEGRGRKRLGREPIWRCMYRYVWFTIFFAELWSVVDYFNRFCFIGRALGYNAGGKAWWGWGLIFWWVAPTVDITNVQNILCYLFYNVHWILGNCQCVVKCDSWLYFRLSTNFSHVPALIGC